MNRSMNVFGTLPLHVAALLGAGALAAAAGVVGPLPSAHGAEASICQQDPAAWPKATASATDGKLGGTVTLSGSGWCHPDGAGSKIGVKIDEGAISHLDTTVHANKTIWAIVDADADGTFTATITLPDGTAATSSPALTTGEHSFRLLSGTLRPGDTGRTISAGTFNVGKADAVPPTWGHQELTTGGATVWVEDVVATGNGSTVRIKGDGWLRNDGSASTVAVKLNSAPAAQYSRPAGEVITHPTAAGDTTIWALLVPGGGSQDHVFTMNADGAFEATLDLPAGLTEGQYVGLSLSSGRFASGDVTRSVRSKPLVVGATRGTAEVESDGTCTPTSTRPTVRITTPTVAPGGRLHITGTGWCHPSSGGSRVGIKIDEGGISHLDSAVHSNRTIWAVVQANHRDGTLSADITMPDGTTATSTPALANGSHRLRLLTGSLKDGDPVRTLLSEEFVVGSYRPNGTPEPLAAEDLTDRVRGGIAATLTARRLSVYVPQGRAGDWVHLSAYLPNSSPTYPWGSRWYRLDAAGRVSVTVPAQTPGGPVKLVVTNGNQASAGDLIGWDDIVLPTPRAAATTRGEQDGRRSGNEPAAASTSTVSAPGAVTPATVANLVATPVETPLSEPRPPAKNFVGVGVLDKGGVTSSLTGSLLSVTFPTGKAGELVHTRVYGTDDVPAGWGMLTEAGVLMLDLKDLPTGTYRFAFQGTDGALRGWTEVEWDTHGSTTDETVTPQAQPEETAPIQQAGASWTASPLDGVLIGVGALAVAVSALTRRRTGGAA